MSSKSRPTALDDHPPPSPKNPPPKRVRVQQGAQASGTTTARPGGATSARPSEPISATAQARAARAGYRNPFGQNGRDSSVLPGSSPPPSERSSSPVIARRAQDGAAAPATGMVRLPKAWTDKILAMQDQLNSLPNSQVAEKTEQDIQYLHGEVNELRAWCHELDGTLEEVKNEMARTLERLEALTVHDVASQSTAQKPKTRDSPLSNTIRVSMKNLMGLTSTKILPNPITVKGKPAFWLVRGELRVLRPQWESTWEANALAWVDEVAAKIKSHGHLWDLRTTAAVLKEYTLEAIAQAIHTAFENYQQQYQLSRKPIAIQAARRSATRRNARKKAKANLRSSYRSTVPALAGPEYDHAFTTGYQSTDSSVRGDLSAIDPATDDEGVMVSEEGVKVLQRVKATSEPFETHAPTYRLDETTPLLDELDSNIAKARGPANRRRGAPRDKPLPHVRKTKGKTLVRIPRKMINPVWLAEHEEYDKPRFMAAEGGGKHEEGEDGEGEGEEGQEDEGIESMYLDPRLQDE